MVQRFGNAHDAMRLADHIADTGHVLDLAPDGEGKPVIAVDRRRRDERPEIPVDLGLDLRLDRLDRRTDPDHSHDRRHEDLTLRAAATSKRPSIPDTIRTSRSLPGFLTLPLFLSDQTAASGI